MPIRSYLGPAKLVAGTREEPVKVQLVDRATVHGPREWGGRVWLGADLLWDMLASPDLRLCVDAREGRVTVVSQAVSGGIEVLGVGDAPF